MPNQAATAALKTPPKVRWPETGSADLDLTNGAQRAVIGGLSVAVTGAPVAAAAAGASQRRGQTGSPVQVRVLDRATATRAGASGPVLVVGATKAGRTAGPVRVEIGYRDFADGYGGDYGARLRFVALPGCALSTPERPECQRGTPVASTNDGAAKTLAATVDVQAGAVVLAAEPEDTSSQGTYSATKLAPSSKWDVSLASGGFSWTYPLRSPPTPGGLVPEVTLGYASQAVDARTSNTNN